MTTVDSALREATARLRPSSPTARLDAEVLLGHVLGLSRTQIIAALRDPLGDEPARRFQELLRRREALEPVAYLLGEREFYGLTLTVDRRVLVPRPVTELLVDLAIRAARRFPLHSPLRVADIGTGTGAIAVAIARHLANARVWAVDLSADALDVARTNVLRHSVEDRVTLLHGDGLAPLPGAIDLLLSNPPYTLLGDVDENVRLHEPHLALDGGPDGLGIIRKLFTAAPRYITRGSVLLEIGAWQGSAVRAIAEAAFPQGTITIHPDLAGLDRVIEIVL